MSLQAKFRQKHKDKAHPSNISSLIEVEVQGQYGHYGVGARSN